MTENSQIFAEGSRESYGDGDARIVLLLLLKSPCGRQAQLARNPLDLGIANDRSWNQTGQKFTGSLAVSGLKRSCPHRRLWRLYVLNAHGARAFNLNLNFNLDLNLLSSNPYPRVETLLRCSKGQKRKPRCFPRALTLTPSNCFN